MKFSLALPFRKKELPEYFLALLFRNERITGVIFEQLEGKIKIIGQHEEYLKENIDDLSSEDFLETLDIIISTAEEPLPTNIQTQKTIFAVQEEWLEHGKIKKDHLLRLKKASSELNLTPIGFLVITEAITHLLQKEEGAPASVLLTEVEEKTLTITVVRAGKIIETKSSPIHDSIVLTADNLLKHFTKSEILPARIILLQNGKNKDIMQEFIGHSWSKSLAFLHVPQILEAPHGFEINAVIYGAASQLGFEVLQDTPDEIIPKTKDQPSNEDIDTTETFGFVKEQDVAKKTQPDVSQDELIEPTEKPKDMPKTAIEEEQEPELIPVEDLPVEPVPTPKIRTESSPLSLKNPFYHFSNLFNFIPPVLARIKIPLPKKNTRLFLIPTIFIGCIVAGILLYIFGLKSTVVLELTPKIIEQEKEITFSTEKDTSLDGAIIKSEDVSIAEQGSLSTPATGKKETGEKAKGNVTIYNSSLAEAKTFPKDTLISGPGDLQFTLDSTVNLASASGDASSITSSTAKVSVTAKDIGKEFNLPSGTKFTLGTIPSTIVIAKNDSAFTGGTKKEITVIAKKDQDKLLTTLPENLQDKAKDDITKKIPNNKSFLTIFTNTSVDNEDFDKKAGDEAQSVTLKATVTYNTLSYDKKTLSELSQHFLQNSFANMRLTNEGVTYSIESAKQTKNKDISATVHMKASLIPRLDTSSLARTISGKSFEEARIILAKTPQTSDVRISLSPPIPFLPSIVSHMPNNISIVIKTP